MPDKGDTMPILDALNWISSHPATSMFGAYVLATIAARLAHELWPEARWVDALNRLAGDLRPKNGKLTITVDESKDSKP